MSSFIDSYTTRAWRVAATNPDVLPPIVRAVEQNVCKSTSFVAEQIGQDPQRFYFDVEVAAAGLGPLGVLDQYCLYLLEEEWMGHAPGTLVLAVFRSQGTTYLAEVTLNFDNPGLARANPRQAEDFILLTRRAAGYESLWFTGRYGLSNRGGLETLVSCLESSEGPRLGAPFKHRAFAGDKDVAATYTLYPTDIEKDNLDAIVSCNTRADGTGITVTLSYGRVAAWNQWELERFDFGNLVPRLTTQ